jgi:hypothetical protein
VKVQDYYGAPPHLTQAPKATAARSEAQARCDAIQAEFRSSGERRSIRRDPPPLPAALQATDDVLLLRSAEELEFARRMLEQMGDTLSADPGVVMRHMVALQSVDIIGQMLGHIANIVRSSDPKGAAERIGMCDLKSRLLRNGGV